MGHMIHRPALSDDPHRNRRLLQAALDTVPAGKLELPRGTYVVADGLRVPAGWTVRGHEVAGANGGPPASWLVAMGRTGTPLLHVTGSDVSISDVGLRPAPADPGPHGGDRGTAVTVGEYLYDEAPAWISRIDVRRVHVDRPDERRANCIALMGAVHDITVHDVTIRGGYTGLAVHWGAVGAHVSSIVSPTYHPHHVRITDLRVRGAVEGFYLSSVYDATVIGSCLRDVEFGFRLLPGDNTDRWALSSPDHSAPRIGSDIEIADACVTWHGPRFGARICGWGRSEVDGRISHLQYAGAVVRNCRLIGSGSGPAWSPLFVEQAPGVELRGVTASSIPDTGTCCTLAARG
jgi:hypothetical protein